MTKLDPERVAALVVEAEVKVVHDARVRGGPDETAGVGQPLRIQLALGPQRVVFCLAAAAAAACGVRAGAEGEMENGEG